MLYNFNEVFLEGRLVADPEYKVFGQDGEGVVNFNIGHNHRYPNGKNADETTKWEEKPTFVPVSAFNGVGKRAAETLKKGDQVIVRGRLEQSNWEKEGEKHSMLRIVADKIDYIQSAKSKETTKA